MNELNIKQINNNKELESYIKSYTNLVIEYCAYPNHCLGGLIKERWFGVAVSVTSYKDTLLKHEQEMVEPLITELYRTFGRFIDKREEYLTSYRRKKYSYNYKK